MNNLISEDMLVDFRLAGAHAFHEVAESNGGMGSSDPMLFGRRVRDVA